jgi:hypothetical protein
MNVGVYGGGSVISWKHFVKGKGKIHLKWAMKAQRESTDTALLFA